jgi:hypothetical protein
MALIKRIAEVEWGFLFGCVGVFFSGVLHYIAKRLTPCSIKTQYIEGELEDRL